MKLKVNDTGTLREFRKIFMNDGGELRDFRKGFVNDTGTLRQFFSRDSILPPASKILNSSDESGQLVTATLHVDNDGGFRVFVENAGSGSTVDSGEWHTAHPEAGLGDEVFVRMSHVSGTNRYFSGSGLDSFLALSTSRSWTWRHSATGPNTDSGVFQLEWSSDGVSVDIGTTSVPVNLENLSP